MGMSSINECINNLKKRFLKFITLMLSIVYTQPMLVSQNSDVVIKNK